MIPLNFACASAPCFQGPPKECFTVRARSAFSGISDPEAQVSSCSIKSFHRATAERGREGRGEGNEENNIVLIVFYIAPQLKYYFLKGHNLFWRHGVITTSTYFHRGVTRSILHCAFRWCCFCRTPCYAIPGTVLTVLFNLSQFLQSSGEQNRSPLPKPQEFCLHQDCKNNLPSTTVFLPPKKVSLLLLLLTIGESHPKKINPQPGPPRLGSQRDSASTHAQTHTYTHTGLCPALSCPVPCRPSHGRYVRGPGVPVGWMQAAKEAVALCSAVWGTKGSFQPSFLPFLHWRAWRRERSLQPS